MEEVYSNLGRECIEMYSQHIKTNLMITILRKGRNHGKISYTIQPFPRSLFQLWFATLSEKSDQFLLQKKRDQLKLIVNGDFHLLDGILGDNWKKIDVLLDDKYNDGWFELAANNPVVITFNNANNELQLLYYMIRFNKVGTFNLDN